MQELLEFVVAYFGFLWSRTPAYNFVESAHAVGAGDACLVIASDVIVLRFVRDRGQLSLELRPAVTPKGKHRRWYSVDLLRRLVTGQRQLSGLLDPDHAAFLKENFDMIEASLSDPERRADTEEKLAKLARMRAKELFG